MRDPQNRAIVAGALFFLWLATSLLSGWSGWLAVPAGACWLAAALLSVAEAPGSHRAPLKRLIRNARWMPGITFFGGLMVFAGLWLLPDRPGFAWSWVGVGVVFPLVALWLFATGRLGVERSVEVAADEVRRLEGGEVTQRVAWADLQMIAVVTTAGGPVNEDMYWVLSARDGQSVAVPLGAAQDELVPRALTLPGFNLELLAEALGSTSSARFVVWERE